jgi:hypothetical protein
MNHIYNSGVVSGLVGSSTIQNIIVDINKKHLFKIEIFSGNIEDSYAKLFVLNKNNDWTQLMCLNPERDFSIRCFFDETDFSDKSKCFDKILTFFYKKINEFILFL